MPGTKATRERQEPSAEKKWLGLRIYEKARSAARPAGRLKVYACWEDGGAGGPLRQVRAGGDQPAQGFRTYEAALACLRKIERTKRSLDLERQRVQKCTGTPVPDGETWRGPNAPERPGK